MTGSTCDVLITEADYVRLMDHLFPGDRDEHGAVVTAGVVEDGDAMRLTVRDVFPARFGTDYTAGTTGYRALQPSFIHRRVTACRDEKLAYLAVHNHDCDNRVGFSQIDMASHDRGYPALLDIGGGVPVGALVLGRRSMQADIWSEGGSRRTLGECRVIGSTLKRVYPEPVLSTHGDDAFDRQVRMFGAGGQAMLSRAKVAVIGLGGVGALVSEYLARLGVGEIVAVDPDHIEASNLSRVVGATRADAQRATPKTEVAARHAAEMGDGTRVTCIDDDIAKRTVADQLRTCDYLFLAADSMRARLVFNALVHQYLIPGVQLGAKVRSDPNGELLDVMSAVRPVRPGEGCLWCNQLIDPHRLALEAKSDDERRAQAYGVKEPNPSVITLNAVSAAHAVNDFLFFFLNLSEGMGPLAYKHFHFLDGETKRVMPRHDRSCRECGREGRFARGDSMELPCMVG